METNYLSDFLALAAVCNYGEAAEQLFISQSSLFKHIKTLESELGVPLFDKNGKKISLSRYGSVFTKYAKQILEAQNACLGDLRQAMSSFENQLSIWSNYRITDLIRTYHTVDPEARIRNDVGSYLFSDIRKALQRHRHELFFLAESEPFALDLERLPYTTDQLALVTWDGHPLADRECVHLSELVNEQFVMLPTDQDVEGDPFAEMLKVSPFAPRVAITGSRYRAILEMVADQIGISVLFENAVGDMRIKGIRTVPLLPRIPHTVCLCWFKGVELSPCARAFVEYVRDHPREELIQPG